MIKSATLLGLLLILTNSLFGQYDSECFIEKREKIRKEVAATPLDTIKFDTLTVFRPRNHTSVVSEIIGCKLPDFTYYDIQGNEGSLSGIHSDFVILNYNFIDCGDQCNLLIKNFSKLKGLLGDSLTVININKEPRQKVEDFSKLFDDNVKFVADAERIYVNADIDYDFYMVFLLDKYKNIIFIQMGPNASEGDYEVYYQYLEKIRDYHCSN